MSVLRPWRTVKPLGCASGSSSRSRPLGIAPRLELLKQKSVPLRSGTQSSILTRRTTHLLRMAEAAISHSDSRVSSQSDCNSEAGFSSVDLAYAEIIVVRHGETAWNADGIIQGHLDVELNDVGRRQAVAVADRLSREPRISAVYSSDLKRALETAQIIATSCGGLEVGFENQLDIVSQLLEVIKDPDMRERHLGDLQGLAYKELAKLNPKAYQAFVSQRTDQEIPGGGESRDQLSQRCTSSLQRIGRKHKGERVVVVTHGGVIRSLYRRASPTGSGGKVLNTSVNIFHLSDGDSWIVKAWGDVTHLNQAGFLKSGFGGDRTSG